VGPYKLTATVVNNGTVISSAPVTIFVETSAPFSVHFVTVSPSLVAFNRVGDQVPLRVTATGSRATGEISSVDVTHSTNIRYLSANPEIAAVDANGILKALSAGGTRITACYEICPGFFGPGLSSNIMVTVPLGEGEAPTYNITARPTTSTLFFDSQGNYSIYINIVNNSNIAISLLNITQVLLNNTPTIVMPVPINNFIPGTARTVNFLFPNPAAGEPGSTGLLRVTGAYVVRPTGGGATQRGAINFTFRIRL
jgi:hypothetical protein